MEIKLYNSLTRQKEIFTPIEPNNIGMYVCGPTVYDRPHIGNARAVVVFDILYRILCHKYGVNKVRYVRNITDVDDKINKRSVERGISIQDLTTEVITQFNEDMGVLNCLQPTDEPRATESIDSIIQTIERMIDNGHAYESEEHVLCDVTSLGEDYGKLSGKKLDEMIAGARIEVESYKKNPGDFVLWKPAKETDDKSSRFDSPWGIGRPGWHIECTAMSTNILGNNFDIHGGGQDLKFPHHENEIAQNICANPGSNYANYWVHNGFVTVEGEKMSKSLGNFTTVHDLLQDNVLGNVIRLTLLSTHYRKPLDFSQNALNDAKSSLQKFSRKIENIESSKPSEAFLNALYDDMNLPKAFSILHGLEDYSTLKASLEFIGIEIEVSYPNEIIEIADKRLAAKKSKDFQSADKLREEAESLGYRIKDTKDSYELEQIL